MTCSNCGMSVPEGALFCPNCGQEIQWVPDYEPLGTFMERDRLQKEAQRKALEAQRKAQEAQRREQEARAAAKRKAEEELKRKKQKQTIIAAVSAAAMLLLLAAALIFMKIQDKNQKYNDFNYQMGMAETEFSNGRYEESFTFVNRALELKTKDIGARLLKAQLQIKFKETNQAVRLLKEIIADDASNESAYSLLIRLYMEQDMTEDIKSLLDNCKDEKILSRYEDYISSLPVFSLTEGKYVGIRKVQLYAKNDITAIYYTLDGSDPTKNSTLYTGEISLPEGTTVVKAIAVNKNGVVSDVVRKQYIITLLPPAAPQISPSSGKFTTDMDTNIYVIVPKGCTAYYSFDKKPTIASHVYNPENPVKMPMGTHTFYAILVDEHGKVSSPGSAIYILSEPE